ncbi:MAG: DUF1819 family protein [Chloroflexaceae bacterium]|nr:DUF1819 family protein [Chloroflexaceae bacterium]
MVVTRQSKYSSKIIKAGALLPDTRTMLSHWDAACSVADNLERLRRENVFGKASRSRVEDILAIFRQRYFRQAEAGQALMTLSHGALSVASLNQVLYFYATQADPLLHDVVTEVLYPRYMQGRTDMHAREMQQVIARWVDEGKTTTRWSDTTIIRVGREVMATLRDFGILEGANHKRLAAMHVPIDVFAYVAFLLYRHQPSSTHLLNHPEWQLFFLHHSMVERLLIEAHQERLLEYYAAGSLVRVAFPTDSLVEYAHVITQRAR